MVNLTIDGQQVAVPKGTTVYQAAKNMGINLPIFCYQDRMPPFGACRVCLVEVEKMGKLQTSCTLEVAEGMNVRTQSQIAIDGRKEILEFLLINHPLDCPICDRGGECPLQDQALEFGPGESRFYEEKRHFTKAKPLGPVLMLDRERCIQCARCTRFGDEIAGDHALEFIDRGYRLEVGTPNGEPVESKFIGNTIMICPVGALTSQVYRFRARPWDNDSTPTTCTLCPVGCSMHLDARDGEIVRTRSREDRDVNDIWLCDKGWFGYEFTSSEERLTKPLIRKNGQLQEATWKEALDLIAKKMKSAGGKIAGLGGNPLTFEENFLFQKVVREASGNNHVDHRVGMPIFSVEEEGAMPGMEMAIGDAEKLSYVLIFGVDLTEEFPVIWLRLRQAIQKGAKVFYFGHYAPEIARYFTKTFLHAPGDELNVIEENRAEIEQLSGTGALFVGRQYLDNDNRQTILSSLTQFKGSFNVLEGKGNSMGARYAGMRPDLGPFGKKVDKPGLNTLQVLEESAKNGWEVLYIAGADLATQVSSKLWSEARKKIDFLVVQDLFLTSTAAEADVVLPTLSYVEKGGSFVNIEGRVQKLLPGKEIPEGIFSDFEIFSKLAGRLGIDASVSVLPAGRLSLTRPQPSARAVVKLDGALKGTLAPALFDDGVRLEHGSHVRELAKEGVIRINGKEAAKRNLRSGEKITLTANGRSIDASLQIDDRVASGTVVLPVGFEAVPVQDLATNYRNGFAVELQGEKR